MNKNQIRKIYGFRIPVEPTTPLLYRITRKLPNTNY